jgi:hypothetical protein
MTLYKRACIYVGLWTYVQTVIRQLLVVLHYNRLTWLNAFTICLGPSKHMSLYYLKMLWVGVFHDSFRITNYMQLMTGDEWIGFGSSLSWPYWGFFVGTGENAERPHWRWLVITLRFEWSTSRIQYQSISLYRFVYVTVYVCHACAIISSLYSVTILAKSVQFGPIRCCSLAVRWTHCIRISIAYTWL